MTTPDDSLDLLVNRWLPNQIIASRLWGRTGYYQPGGAYGFRDQLQDVSALVLSVPTSRASTSCGPRRGSSARETCSTGGTSRSGSGTRTRCSDDLLWLPWAGLRYVEATGDAGVWDENAPYLEGPTLAEGQRESYFEPTVSSESDTLFGHAARAMDASLTAGAQGLPADRHAATGTTG